MKFRMLILALLLVPACRSVPPPRHVPTERVEDIRAKSADVSKGIDELAEVNQAVAIVAGKGKEFLISEAPWYVRLWKDIKLWATRALLALGIAASFYLFGFWPIKVVSSTRDTIRKLKSTLKKTTVSVDRASLEAQDEIKASQDVLLDTDEKAILKSIRTGNPA